MHSFKITFCDNSPDVIDSLKKVFKSKKDINFIVDDILKSARGTLLSPANSFGFMDGGVDLDYVRHFGTSLQINVHRVVGRRPEGFLPVGAAELVITNDPLIPRLIIAPTMLEPEAIVPYQVFRAFRAALKLIEKLKITGDIYSPGFGTGIGRVDPDEAAKMMFKAYENVVR